MTQPAVRFRVILLVSVSCVMLMASCGGNSSDEVPQIPVPQVTVLDAARPLRCEAVLISEPGADAEMYRNFYIEINEDGTESIVNQVEGNQPCP